MVSVLDPGILHMVSVLEPGILRMVSVLEPGGYSVWFQF